MGKNLNLSHLTDVECEQIMNVLQKDFENRRLEKKRISEVHDELVKEQSRIAVLKENQKFTETSCIICLERFGLISHRKRKCYRCSLNICSVCSQARAEKKKGFICQVCQKEKEYKILSNQWFYNTQVSDNTFGSSKVVRSLYKRAPPAVSDTDVDSGYSLSSVSSAAPSKPPRTRVENIFDISLKADDNDFSQQSSETIVHNTSMPQFASLDAHIDQSRAPQPLPRSMDPQTSSQSYYNQISDLTVDETTTETSHQVPAHKDTEITTEVSNAVVDPVVPKQRTSILDATRSNSQKFDLPVPRVRKQRETNTPGLYKEALDEARRAVEFQFRVDFEELLEDLQASLEEKESGGLSTSFASPSDEELMLTFKDKVKDLLTRVSERLQLSYESSGAAQSQTSTRQNVNQIMCKCIDDLIGGNADLTSEEAISDLLLFSNDSSTNAISFEDLVAQVVVSKFLDNQYKEDGKTLWSSNTNSVYETSMKDFSTDSEDQLHHSNAGFNSIKSDLLSDETDEESNKYFDKVNYNSVITKANNEKKSTRNASNIFYGRENTRSDGNGKTNKNNGQAYSFNSEVEYDDGGATADERDVVNEESSIVTEFQELKDFVTKTSRRPKVEAVVFDDSGLCEVEEETVMKTEVDQDELKEEFHARYSIFDRIRNSGSILPDISQFDSVNFASDEIDPDLLSLNLEIIPEETEEELGQEIETKGEHANWIFKSKGLLPYKKIRKKPDKLDSECSMFLRVASPEDIYIPRIGHSTIDHLSDLSDLEGTEDEENTFYANTSKELARIDRQRNRLSQSHWLQPGYHSDDSDFHDRVRRQNPVQLCHQSSIDYTDIASSMEHISRPMTEPNKQEVKLLQDLIPAENDDPKFEVAPESVTIQEGEPVKFFCRVVGTGHIDVFWYREGDEIEELEDSSDVEITNDGDKHSIILYNISKKMGGQYICIAVNEQGKAIQYLVVTIKDNKQELRKPEFLKGLKDVEVTEGQSVKFRVKVKGYPPPRISWYKDGELLKSSKSCRIEKFGNRDYILIIDHASMHDDAEYTVIARNVAGEQHISAQVIVEPKSDLTVKKQNISTTTSGVSDSDSDMSMSYRSRILAANSAISLTPATAALSTSRTHQRENVLSNNSLNRNTTFTQNKVLEKNQTMYEELEKGKATSKRLVTSDVQDVLRIAEDIIHHEKHTSANTKSQKLNREVSLPSEYNNKNNQTTSPKLQPGITEDLALQDILDDFSLPVCDTKTLAQNQPSFDYDLPEIHKHQQVLRSQYSRDFQVSEAAEKRNYSKSFSPQPEEIHKQKKTEKLDERVHSITARNVPKEQLEKLRASNQSQQLSASSSNLPDVSASHPILSESLEMNNKSSLSPSSTRVAVSTSPLPHAATAHRQQLVQAAPTEDFIHLELHKDPVLIYQANESMLRHDTQQQNATKSRATSKLSKTSLILQPSPQQAAKQVSKNTVKQLATSPKPGLGKSRVISHGETETAHKNGPRIKTGCISARAAFWERKIADGGAVKDEEFPNMVESNDV